MNKLNRSVRLSKGLMLLMMSLLVACSANTTISLDIGDRDLVNASPESVGMDSDRLDRVTAAMQEFVDDGLLSGAVTMVARDNKIVHFESVGQRDIEAGSAMTNDTIFRIYSMSKPITGVALMMLYEEGMFKLSDPVEKHLPEFKDMQVFAGMDDDGNMITEPSGHPMTIRELMSHTGGLTYGIFAQSPVDNMYVDAGMLDTTMPLSEMVARLGKIPLKHQPGSAWEYSVSVDVQGYLVEKLAGQSFGSFLEERIFTPLKMTDTDFHVPTDKADRFAQMYVNSAESLLTPSEMFAGADFLVDPVLEGGGGGLVSSTMDYMRFSQMLLNGGELDGIRILAPLTVDLMHRDQLPDAVKSIGLGNRGTTFGLDFAIIEDTVEAEGYSKGEYFWGGAAGTWFWIDPVENLVFIGMIQQAGPMIPDVRGTSKRLLYQSIMDAYGI